MYLRANLNSRHCACRFGVCKGISVNNPVAMIYDARWIFIDKWSCAFCAGSIWYFVVTRRPDRGMTAGAFLGRNAVHGEIVVISGYVARWSPYRGRNYVNYECCLTACQLHPITDNCHDPRLCRSGIRIQRVMHIERKLWERTCAELQTGRINSRSVIHAATNMTGSGTTRFLQGGHICMNLNFYGKNNRNLILTYVTTSVFHIELDY